MSLPAIIQLTRDKLRTAMLGADLADGLVVERAVLQAATQYGTDMPRRRTTLVTGLTGSTVPLPSGWVPDRSALLAVEYPLGQAPMATVPAQVALKPSADEYQVYLLDTTLSAASLRLHWTSPHELTAEACSIGEQHWNALACWAAGEVCRQLATAKASERDATMSAVQVNQGSQSGDLARRARDWLREYRQALGLPDPEQATHGDAACAVVSWGHRRPRPRISTQQV